MISLQEQRWSPFCNENACGDTCYCEYIWKTTIYWYHNY